MLISETTRDLVLATGLTAAAVGLVFSVVYKSPRKPRRRFKGDRPPAVARIPGKVSPRVIAARISNLAVIAGIASALWVRRYREQVVIVTDAGADKGLTTEALGRDDGRWWIVNRSSHPVRIEKLLYPSARDAKEIPPGVSLGVDHVDAIGPDHQPELKPGEVYTYWLTWD